MSRRGRGFKVNLDSQKTVYLEHKDVLYPIQPKRNDAIYDLLFNKFDKQMSKDAIFLSIKKNHALFFCSNVKQEEEREKQSISSNELVLETEFSTRTSSAGDNYVLNEDLENQTDSEITFSIVIDAYQWREIEPTKYYYYRNDPKIPNSRYKSARRFQKQKWTTILRQEIWKQSKNECIWIFKKNRVQPNGHILCQGYCKLCKANLNIYYSENCCTSSENFYEMKCSITNVNKNYKHDKSVKVRVTKYHKQQLEETLAKNHPIITRNLLANQHMEIGDVEPPIIPNIGALQKIRSRMKQAPFLHSSPVLSVWCMAFTPPYNETIRQISIFPFFILYWSREQNYFYNLFSRSERYIRVSIDATGSVVKGTVLPEVNIFTKNANKQKKHVFLYVMMCYREDGSSIPLCHMLSEVNTQENISMFLKQWLSGKSAPNECVSDDSAAILGAVVTNFTGFISTNSYLQNCFNILEGDNHNNIRIPCYIRLDKSHFVKNLYRQSCFEHVDNRVKNFYVRCVLLLRQTANYSQLKNILDDIITLALNRYGGLTDQNKVSRCSNALLKLQSIIMNLETIPSDMSKEDITTECIEEYDDIDENPLIRFCKNVQTRETIYNENITPDFDNENLYYFPTFLTYLYRI